MYLLTCTSTLTLHKAILLINTTEIVRRRNISANKFFSVLSSYRQIDVSLRTNSNYAFIKKFNEILIMILIDSNYVYQFHFRIY